MKKISLLALLIVLCLCMGLLSGCGSQAASSAPASETEASAEAAASGETGQEAEATVAAPAEETGSTLEEEPVEEETPEWVYEPIEYPIADGNTTLDYWVVYELSPDTKYSDISEHVVIQMLLDATGVKLNVLAQSQAAGQTNTELMIASGDYPDLIGMFSYATGMDAAIEDEVVVNIKDKIPEYSPDYYKYLIEDDGALWKAVQTDEGNIGAYVTVGQQAKIDDGMMSFQYMMDELGYDIDSLKTIDQYEAFLTDAKNKYGMASPLYLPGDFMLDNDAICSAYGVALKISAIEGNLPWIVVDDEVKFGYLEDGFEGYVTLMNDWFNKGLIDSDTASHPTEYKNEDLIGLIANKQVAIWNRGSGLIDLFANLSGEIAVPIYFPTVNEGDQLHIGGATSVLSNNNGLVITTGCEDLELAMEFVNYMYTDEFYIPSNYGVEGETYDMIDGEPVFQEWTYSTPGRIFRSVIMDYQMFTMVSANVETPGQSEAALSCDPTWKTNMDGEWTYPSAAVMNMTENDSYNRNAGDIVALCQEYTAKFITGEIPLSEISAFQEKLHTTGIDQCIEAKQSAYDRYMSRE